MAYTRAQGRSLIQQRCDIENATHQQNSEFNNHINDAARYVHDFLISTYGSRYSIAFEGFDTVADQSTYDLATLSSPITDVYRIVQVRLNIDDISYPLGSTNLDGPRYTSSQSWGPGFLPEFMPILQADSTTGILFYPTPDAAHSIQLRYHPIAPEYTSDSDLITMPHTDLLIIEACIRAKDKEERDASRFMQERNLIQKRIEDWASPIDQANPHVTQQAPKGGRALWRRERLF